jgi:hypothetical protein
MTARHAERIGSLQQELTAALGEEDTEAYKMGLDAPLKRWFFATLPGFLLATRAPQDGQLTGAAG